MERIAKAIELARQAATAQPGAVPVNTGTPFCYSKTRTVHVAPERLRAIHVTGGHERTPMAEAFKSLRTQLLQRVRESGANALGVASPRRGEGKTTVALNLAVHAAMETDWTALLVEADLREPALCAALGLPPQPGLTEYLAHGAPLERLLLNPGFGHCLLLPAGAASRGSSELLGSARMEELAQELKRRYPDRLVIYDLPPLLDGADGLAVLPWTDSLVLVVEEGRTQAEDVLRAAQAAGPRLAGTVLNKSRAPRADAPWWKKLL